MTFAHSIRQTRIAIVASFLTVATGALGSVAKATEAGWKSYEVPASAAGAAAISVALFYPTETPGRAIAMGPYTLQVAPMAPPLARLKGLIIVSHGTGGSELGHSGLAIALARDGYLVAALRHPGDNYMDRSLWQQAPGAIFVERPRQASRAIDALLADPDWRDRIATDAKGPLIGAVGHSAGGFTVVALAGGQFDLSLIGTHCAQDRAEDPLFCSMGRAPGSGPAPRSVELPSVADQRIRAIVAMAPVGVVFTAQSLQGVDRPTQIYAAEKDRWLPPRFHAGRIAQNIPGARFQIVPNAWHFAFMDKVGIPIPTLDGDANADPPGFDRAAFLKQLSADIPAFFEHAFARREGVK